LIAAIARGDRTAMKSLYVRHSVRLYRMVSHLTGDSTLAEDIVSETFLEVWRQSGRFKARSTVSTWLFAIARNKAFSALRRRGEAQLDDVTAAAVEDPADSPELLVHNNERSVLIRKCLSCLPMAQREVVNLIYYHEKSLNEVAEIVGVPTNTVKTRLFYARRRLHALLQVAGLEAS
jgi:RNA polymerase sigma-70 factor (ECF subfamily)